MSEAALLAAIAAAPDDDAPRLVFADWLQQRGDAWGEIIVLGCELARRTEPALYERHAALIAQRFADSRMNAYFKRGFCDQLVSSELASAAGAQYALLREADHHDATVANMRALATWPPLARLERLTLRAKSSGSGVGREVPALVAAAHRLRELRLERMDVARTDLAAMFAARSLTRLEVSANESLTNSLADLAWPALDELQLSACDLYGHDVAALLAGERLRELRTLSLEHNEISDDGARAIADHPFTRLATLELGYNEVSARGIALLASAPHLQGLRTLSLGGGYDINIDPALPRLSTGFPALEHLRIQSSFLLPSLPRLGRPLHELHLELREIEPGQLAVTLASPAARALQWLDLSLRDKTGGDALARVIAAAELPALEHLWFRVPIGPTGIAAFARAPHLPATCQLMLSTTADATALRARYAHVVT